MKKLLSVLMILAILATFSAIVVGAESVDSPTKDDNWYITVKLEGDGTATADKYTVIKNSDDSVTLTAKDGADKFSKWTIEGTYDLVEGDTNSRVLTVKPKSDIVATAIFKGSGSSSTASGGTNSSSTSPKTGSFTYAMILTLIALAAGGVAIVVSRKVRQK